MNSGLDRFWHLGIVAIAALAMSLSSCKGDPGDSGPAGQPGPAGQNCTVTDAAAGKIVTCPDGTTVTIKDGEQGPNGGDGESCTLTEVEGVKTITCPDGTTVTVLDGQDGASCTLTEVEGVKTVTCPDGSSFTVTDGVDGESCAVAEANGVKTITCPGGATITISDGEDATLPAGAGAKVTVLSASLAASGAPTVTFRVTDSAGRPVELLAELDSGAISPRFTLASRDATTGVYTSLFTASATGGTYKDGAGATQNPAMGTTTQATYVPRNLSAAQVRALYAEVSAGVYTFTFPAGPASAPDLGLDHTLSVFGTRTFEGVTYPFTASYHFVPSTGVAAPKREVVSDAACNQCHQSLQAHGTRRGVELCLTCHSPQTVDPETGNTMDMRVMVHKIHRGAQSTDPAAGPAWKYQVVGHQQSFMDFSHVSFAAPGNTVRNCERCHQGAQGDSFKYNPSIAACGSCHYTVDFVTGAGHSEGARPDGSCAGCHDQANIAKVHSAKWDPTNNVLFDGKELDVKLDEVTNVVAGLSPEVTFTVKVNGVAHDAKTTPLGLLRFTMAGPTTDISGPGKPAAAGYAQTDNLNNTTATAALTPTGTAGQFKVSLPALDSNAAGTMAFGVEAYVTEKKPDSTSTQRSKSWNAKSASVIYRAIGGGTALKRREIVDDAKCNACHVDLGFHSNSSRHNAGYCAFCHNPNNPNDDRVSRFELLPGTTTNEPWSIVPNTVQLSVMVHKIHKGGELSKKYTLGGNPSPSDTNPAGNQSTITGAYPGDLGNCLGCHKEKTYGLPKADLLPTKMETWTCSEAPADDTDDFCDGTDTWAVTATELIPVQRSSCTSCHDSDSAVAHAKLNTYNGIETCDVCHGAGKELDPLKVHQARP
ncbi:MAG: OmcA/MtrC family decaheme c-type cytochrome [Deltaproteobacteria bacterium]|nr:OmcA/MtrC family decaheme c-type cytochrome [Deltaproteobacteria bacterium]